MRNLENRVDRVESVSGGINGPLSNRTNQNQQNHKLEFMEEKLIETTEIAINAEKKCIELEYLVRDSNMATSTPTVNHIGNTKHHLSDNQNQNNSIFAEQKVKELNVKHEKFEHKVNTKFNQMKI